MTRPLLILDTVSHHFQAASGEVLALRDVSLTVREGEFVALVGPSGCGKTTILRLVAGLIQPEQGRILYDGKLVTEPPDEIGMVFQKATLLPWRTVTDNVRLPLEIAGKPVDSAQIAAMIEAVGLAGFERAMPGELSGGMQQRVSLARALISHPRLLLMDEPFGALDMMRRNEMNLLLLELWARIQSTVLFVTHDIHEAVFLAERVLAMGPRPGRIVGNFPIDLPRPRQAGDRYGREMQDYVERIWQVLERTA
ncbi:MAG: ABC transporter ATP-binding protein [Ardenticatenales bacterium]|nr:ABC transporter ATP-binding protein [Ardenticatenales bacterium]